MTGPLTSGRLAVASWLRDDVFEQDGPANQGIAAVPDAGLDGQVQVVGFVYEAAHLGGCLGDVQNQHAASARDPLKPGRAGQGSMVAKTITLDR